MRAAMTREAIQEQILGVFADKFEIEDPGLDDDLREAYEFDSIDAIDLLASIETMLGVTLDEDQKKRAMEIRTIRDIVDYVEGLARARASA